MGDREQDEPAAGSAPPRLERLAQALRANLARRKAQARTRRDTSQPASPHNDPKTPQKPR